MMKTKGIKFYNLHKYKDYIPLDIIPKISYSRGIVKSFSLSFLGFGIEFIFNVTK